MLTGSKEGTQDFLFQGDSLLLQASFPPEAYPALEICIFSSSQRHHHQASVICGIRWLFLLLHDLPQPLPSSSKPDYFMLTTPLPTVPNSRCPMAWCQPPCQPLLLPISYLCFMRGSTISSNPLNKAWQDKEGACLGVRFVQIVTPLVLLNLDVIYHF